MNQLFGIRREDKNRWEGRVPLVPGEVDKLVKAGLKVILQPSEIRAFPEEDYLKVKAKIGEDLSPVPVIFGIKEMPPDFFEENKTYIFFSHIIKGQKYNMPMLKKLLELKCHLIDYEKITDEDDKRLIFFGKFAGLAGMIDSLWALGEKLLVEGMESPFAKIKPAHNYPDLSGAKAAVEKAGDLILKDGLPEKISPLICAFLGYGNVSLGAQEIFDLLPVSEISPEEIFSVYKAKQANRKRVFKAVFKEEDLVVPKESGAKFQLADYYNHPEKYRSIFYRYLPYLSLIVNGVYWDKHYPRFVTQKALKKLYREKRLPLKVIGDISCDTCGSMECTLKATTPDEPVFTYHPESSAIADGVKKEGVTVMAVDNLPCELPRESSETFSLGLLPFVSAIVAADYRVPFAELNLPPEVKKALIVYQGELTPDYKYLEKYL